MGLIRLLAKKVRDMKNRRKRGRSARNGNQPAPYTKYKKTPIRYSTAYYEWFRHATRNKVVTTKKTGHQRVWKEAAE